MLALQRYTENKIQTVTLLSLAWCARDPAADAVYPAAHSSPVVLPLNNLVATGEPRVSGQFTTQRRTPPTLPTKAGQLSRQHNHMSGRTACCNRSLEASVAERRGIYMRPPAAQTCCSNAPQALNTGQMNMQCFRHFTQIVHARR
ncbi:hypothetical protein [Enterobacter chuandaensis]|uniref:hypothetical protein n=1 Tax=Enterobacter chuandaensis TaxID=2497875 RepID=UPI0020C65087|nr:hypothetical protein [Enterobacter chuandaensis]